MASVQQWKKWQDEYYSGLRQILEESAFALAQERVELDGHTYLPEIAKQFVDEAINAGVIDISDPSSFYKIFLFAFLRETAYYEETSITVEIAESLLHDPECQIPDINSYEGYVCYSYDKLIVPFLKACSYIFKNKPLKFKHIFLESQEKLGNKIDLSYCGLRKEELFGYLRSITPLGLHNILAEIKCPFAEELFDAIREDKYDVFQSICYEKNIDFSEVSEMAGFIQGGIEGGINDLQEIMASDDDSGDAEERILSSRVNPLLSMLGVNGLEKGDIERSLFGKDIVRECVPLVQTEEQAKVMSAYAFEIADLYPLVENMDA